MTVYEVTGKLVLNPKAHGPWCQMPYPGHPKGCPNFGTVSDCPPQVAMLDVAFDLSRPHWFIVETFDLKRHMETMKAKHPAWTDRQQRNCLYWQNGVRKRLRKQIAEFIGFRTLFWTMKPEAMGVNVLQTARRLGIPISTKPKDQVVKIAFVGYPR
jgi:hypothetical protein